MNTRNTKKWKILEKQGFTITKEYEDSTAIHYDGYGRWDPVAYNFKIKRQAKPYVLQYYIPSSVVTIVSFLSFVVPISVTPGRIGLIVTQFLTLTNLFIHQRVSRINYIKAHSPLNNSCDMLHTTSDYNFISGSKSIWIYIKLLGLLHVDMLTFRIRNHDRIRYQSTL